VEIGARQVLLMLRERLLPEPLIIEQIAPDLKA
jgi:hypothetical protein